MNHHDSATILADLDKNCTPEGSHKLELTLARGDTAWNPASTKRLLRGPCKITYIHWPDGGVDAVLA